jgi:hypothetical protein
LSLAYSVKQAAGVAGASLRTLYRRRESDPEFAQQWRQAFDQGTDVLRDELPRRALEGVEEPVFQKGELVGHVRRFSDVLLIFELKRPLIPRQRAGRGSRIAGPSRSCMSGG